jgi:hypothetical protein
MYLEGTLYCHKYWCSKKRTNIYFLTNQRDFYTYTYIGIGINKIILIFFQKIGKLFITFAEISELKNQVPKLRFKIVAKAFLVFLRYTKKMEKKGS